MFRKRYLGLLAVLAVTVACGPGESSPDLMNDAQSLVTEDGVRPLMEPLPAEVYPIDPGMQPLVEMARADLGQRLRVEATEIDIRNAFLVTWPNAALGCPQPGGAYAETILDGSIIELQIARDVYRYHTGGPESTPFYCAEPDDGFTPLTAS